MAVIYLSFNSHIAKVLRHKLSINGAPIDIPPYIRSDNYWRNSRPNISRKQLRRMPSMSELFIKALRIRNEGRSFVPYPLAFSENEYNGFPESDDKRDELVAFQLPKVIPWENTAKTTNANTVMDKRGGQMFRQAAIYYVYDILATHLHTVRQETELNGNPFNISEGIRLFADEYDMTSNEQNTLLTQYYRRKIK